MKYIRLLTTDPYYNLAVEEYLFKNADEDIFMLWQNEPSVIIGRNQNAYAEADLSFAEKRGIHICRRITGGGAVYHDLGNLNYTFISPSADGHALDFEYFSRPIRDALSELGVACRMNGRNDIECERGKLSGNAQRAEGGRILHHGTLLFDADFYTMEAVLRVDKEKLLHRAIKSVRSRVVNICSLLEEKSPISEFISRIEKSVCRMLCAQRIAPPENDEIRRLRERNASASWVLSDKRYLTSYAVHHKKKYPFGLVEAELTLQSGVIESIRFSGDFFGLRPIEELEQMLVGARPEALPSLDPSPYINGMSEALLARLLSEAN